MRKERKSYSGPEKMAILREHFIEGVPVSEVCDRHGLQPSLFYTWQKKLFENGASVFEAGNGPSKRQQDAQAQWIEALEAKLKQKNEVVAELLEEHVALKKKLGVP